MWLDEAIELMFTLPYSCALDVVDAYPDGLTTGAVGWVFGISEQAAQEEIHKPHVVAALDRLRRMADGDEV